MVQCVVVVVCVCWITILLSFREWSAENLIWKTDVG